MVPTAPIPLGDITVGSTPRSIYRFGAIGEIGVIVRAINVEHTGALTMTFRPYSTADALKTASLGMRSESGWLVH